MLNENIYNDKSYNFLEEKNEIYNTSKVGVDFGNGFKIPNQFVKSCMIDYLEPIAKNYGVSSITREQHKIVNIQNDNLVIKISGIIRGENRTELLTNIDYFKKKIRRKKEIIIKDFGVEKIGDVFVESIDFDENHYNMTFIKFEIICIAHSYLNYNKTNKTDYKNIVENNKKIVFENTGLETDFVGIFEIIEAQNINLNFRLNGVSLGVENVNTGDFVILDTKKVSVKKGSEEVIFTGILEKIKEGENEIVISDNGNTRKYNFSLFYKNSLS